MRMKAKSLISGFVESAKRFASRPALVVGADTLTYGELLGLAGGIASTILQTEQEPSPLAAVLASRSISAYAGMLGILGAGKGYVPLNPKFPIERTRKMLVLSGSAALVVGRESVALLPSLLSGISRRLAVILPDVADAGDLAAAFPQHRFVFTGQMSDGGGHVLSSEADSRAVAYLLFTSGSTGEPKGVPISHSNVRRYIEYIADRYEVSERDRFSQQFDLTFDLSVHDMFVCWERGACLFSVPETSVMLPAKFIRDHHLTMWFSVPSVAGVLARMRLLQPSSFPSLRYSLFCGEPLPAKYAQLWQEAAPNSTVENLYGPTETTIAISHYRWDPRKSPGECLNGIVPLGWMFEGQQCRIVDGNREVVRDGDSGELCLAGSQVATGYWNDPDKTQQQFIRLAGTDGTPWYRTGDLVKRGANGSIHYLGRMDHQVKIRGYRVELQEIDSVLRKLCGTEQVVTVPWPVTNGIADGVVAFVAEIESLDHERVLKSCSEVLPDYMVPKEVHVLDEFPLTVNGKIDRSRLVQRLSVSNETITEAELTDRVMEWVRKNQQMTESAGWEITPDTDLVAGGLLDSLGLIELIAFIESLDGYRVNLTDVDPDEFSTVKGLCGLALRTHP
jgi:amino acid adenylation domain-containing protein